MEKAEAQYSVCSFEDVNNNKNTTTKIGNYYSNSYNYTTTMASTASQKSRTYCRSSTFPYAETIRESFIPLLYDRT